MKKKINSSDIAIYSLYLALFLVFGLIPITIAGIRIAFVEIPLAVIIIHKKYWGAIFGVFTFAITSFLAMPYASPQILAVYGWDGGFVILFVGRLALLFPIFLALLFFDKFKRLKIYIKSIIIGIIIPVFNTIFVLLLLSAYSDSIFKFSALFSTLIINIVVEWITIPIVTFMLSGMMEYIIRQNKYSKSNIY